MLGHAQVVLVLDVVGIENLDRVRPQVEGPHRGELGLDEIEVVLGEQFVEGLLHAAGAADEEVEEAVSGRQGVQLGQPPVSARPLHRDDPDPIPRQRQCGGQRAGHFRRPVGEDGDVVAPDQVLQEVIVAQRTAERRRDRRVREEEEDSHARGHGAAATARGAGIDGLATGHTIAPGPALDAPPGESQGLKKRRSVSRRAIQRATRVRTRSM